ncbi:GlsB/YeaQ/YmgE family stress response membrane protein [Thiothrix nivea]|uniref:Transglycosylase-associated protein n=1 Tax=Thiothrix nivea (strain ATCC 35100 / DSM 5205 / JP2) TaxID=870187 RepID=A0A656HI67_THINJ|nr:GlsB/YeaQ/YmgE family stress response membrane protein [Thiothrix nivea]EIJ35892.1 Transglycosylase-associated protein [Thiothrix nivea DSM 5205]
MGSEVTQILIMLGIGAVAGWLAGVIMKGAGFGLIGNIIVGIVGSVIGTFIGGVLSINLGVSPILGTLIWAVIGAVILLFIIGLVKRV